MEQGERELASQRLFWERWGAWLDDRDVTAPRRRPAHRLRHRGHRGRAAGTASSSSTCVALRDAGHHVELWSLRGPARLVRPRRHPGARVRRPTASSSAALEPLEAIKVATWWNTAEFVWPTPRSATASPPTSSRTSRRPTTPTTRTPHGRVLDSYRLEFRVLTTSTWNSDRLRELHIAPAIVPPGIDEERFFVRDDVQRRDDVVLALGRTDPLKDFPLTRAAWAALPEPRPELWLFGIEPALADAPGIRYVQRPSDAEVNELLNTATVFVQTSRHEGFCLPILEAMAAGVPVVCTDADGNRDFCSDGVNCLMPERTPAAVAAAIARLLADPDLRARLAAAGLQTAREHRWSARVGELDAFYRSIAPAPSRVEG